MIQSKKDYIYYLECDKIALRKTTDSPKYLHDIIWKFERLLRKCEYYENCRHSFVDRIYIKYLKYQYVKLSQKLGFSIAFNVCGPGLCIEHYGQVLIHQCARVGENCTIKGNVVIGGKGYDEAPSIGNNVLIGFGAAIIGRVTIADNIAIGANAVVVKDILTPNVSVGGVPAKILSNKGSEGYLVKATEIAKKR